MALLPATPKEANTAHAVQIACRDMDASLREAKSLTPKIYQRVGELFRARFGAYAGWAHRCVTVVHRACVAPCAVHAAPLTPQPHCPWYCSILFAAELPAFRPLLPPEVIADMDAFRLAEKELKGACDADAAGVVPGGLVPLAAAHLLGSLGAHLEGCLLYFSGAQS